MEIRHHPACFAGTSRSNHPARYAGTPPHLRRGIIGFAPLLPEEGWREAPGWWEQQTNVIAQPASALGE